MDACIDGAYVKDLDFRSIRDEICELAEKARYCEIVREITYSRVSESTGLVFQCKIRDVFSGPARRRLVVRLLLYCDKYYSERSVSD